MVTRTCSASSLSAVGYLRVAHVPDVVEGHQQEAVRRERRDDAKLATVKQTNGHTHKSPTFSILCCIEKKKVQ